MTELFDSSGSVDHKPYLRDKQFWSIAPTVELVLLHIVLQKPGIYLHEIQKELAEATGVDLSPSAVCRYLKRVGFSHTNLIPWKACFSNGNDVNEWHTGCSHCTR